MRRRELLKTGLYGIGLGATGVVPLPPLFAQAAQALGSQTVNNGRILVVLELSGGNDGLNTLVPYADDAYYRLRPKIGIRPARLRKIDDHFGFHSACRELNGCIEKERWRSSTAAVTRILHFHTSLRWRTGTQLPRTEATNSDGWGGWPMRSHLRRLPTFWSTSTPGSHWLFEASYTHRSCLMIRTSSHERAITKNAIFSRRSRTRVVWKIRRKDSCSSWPGARKARPRW